MALETNALYQGDCIAHLKRLEAGSVQLAFADPPFNIGYEYDVYKDNRKYDEYLSWTKEWMAGVSRALHSEGSFWIAIGDEYAAEIKLIAQKDLGLTCRNWVIWYYTFGVHCTRKFTRSHAHLFYFVKDPKRFTFNADDPQIRVPSARQLVYADGRANPKGRLPDDTWILRPQDVPHGFARDQDTWYFPRVAGTFKERAGFHGCQMPEQLLGRIIRACSNPGELVLDPFGGSGTTLTVAKKLGRQWIGFELSKDYVKKVRARLDAVRVGQPLDGAEEPLLSAPATPGSTKPRLNGRGPHVANGAIAASLSNTRFPNANPNFDWNDAIRAAFAVSHEGHSADYLLADPELNASFLEVCKREGIPGSPRDWNRRLLGLRKSHRLPTTGRGRSKKFRRDMDSYAFASEIALSTMTERHDATLDDLLCDPILAREFDTVAQDYAPGFSAFEYRWAALAIRKRAHEQRKRAANFVHDFRRRRLSYKQNWSAIPFDSLRNVSGVYLLHSEAGKEIYAGGTLSLGERLRALFEMRQLPGWKPWKPTFVRFAPSPDKIGRYSIGSVLDAFQSTLIARRWPRLNYKELAAKDFAAA